MNQALLLEILSYVHLIRRVYQFFFEDVTSQKKGVAKV